MKGITNYTDRETMRAARQATRANFDTVVATFKETYYKNNERPDQTVAAIVDALGYDAAVVTVAEIVNSVGDWDERVSAKNREWAAGIENAATRDELRTADIYQPSEIHPCHIDSLASAMRRYEPKQAEPETVEQATEEITEDAQNAPKNAQEDAEQEHAVVRKALMLERRGCEFFASDESTKASDIGNYRLVVPGYIFDAKNGRRYCIEITKATKYRERKTNKRTGAPLKNPVRELVSDCVAHFSFSFEDERGTWGDLEQDRAAWAAEIPYTSEAIIAYLNTISARPINKLLFVESFDFDNPTGKNFVPGWKALDWAKASRLEWWYDFDALRINTKTGVYSYHHYNITPAGAGRERVRIYLERVAAAN